MKSIVPDSGHQRKRFIFEKPRMKTTVPANGHSLTPRVQDTCQTPVRAWDGSEVPTAHDDAQQVAPIEAIDSQTVVTIPNSESVCEIPEPTADALVTEHQDDENTNPIETDNTEVAHRAHS